MVLAWVFLLWGDSTDISIQDAGKTKQKLMRNRGHNNTDQDVKAEGGRQGTVQLASHPHHGSWPPPGTHLFCRNGTQSGPKGEVSGCKQGIEGEDIREFGTFQGEECGKEFAKIRHTGEEILRITESVGEIWWGVKIYQAHVGMLREETRSHS